MDTSRNMLALCDHPVATAWSAISAAVVALPRNYRHRAFLTDWAVPVDGRDSGHGSVRRAALRHGLTWNKGRRIVRVFLRDHGLRLPRTGGGRVAREACHG